MSSNPIYGFKPTYLYIKRHSVTGKLYFGKTIKDPETYKGSGTNWSRHIKKHGVEHIETLWYCLFLDQESITEFALNFSKQENIVESKDWLNLQDENGIDGAPIGIKRNIEQRLKISQSRKSSQACKESSAANFRKAAKMNMGKSGPNKGKKFSAEYKQKLSIIQRSKEWKDVTCPHCNKTGGQTAMKRWHFNNCKMRYSLSKSSSGPF